MVGGLQKSTIVKLPSGLIAIWTAASSMDVGGCRPGTGMLLSCEAYLGHQMSLCRDIRVRGSTRFR